MNGDIAAAVRGKRAAADGSGRDLRLRTGLPLEVCAKAIGVSARTLHRWERGTSPNASHAAAYGHLLDHLDRLSRQVAP